MSAQRPPPSPPKNCIYTAQMHALYLGGGDDNFIEQSIGVGRCSDLGGDIFFKQQKCGFP